MTVMREGRGMALPKQIYELICRRCEIEFQSYIETDHCVECKRYLSRWHRLSSEQRQMLLRNKLSLLLLGYYRVTEPLWYGKFQEEFYQLDDEYTRLCWRDN